MARVTVEDCLERVSNRFALTVLASRRARALSEGRGTALVECDNKEGVTALREISAQRVRWIEDVDETMREFIEEARSRLRSTAGEHTFLEAASLTGAVGEDEDDLDDAVQELPADLEKLGTGTPEGEDGESTEEAPEGTSIESDDSEETPAEGAGFPAAEVPDAEGDDDDESADEGGE